MTALLSLRTTVILTTGAAAGVLVGILSLASGADAPAAVLAGLPAGAATVAGLHQLVEKRPFPSSDDPAAAGSPPPPPLLPGRGKRSGGSGRPEVPRARAREG
jgi:hypothetical protein